MKNKILILTISIYLVGCASTSSQNARTRNLSVTTNAKRTLANKDSDEKVICKQERRMGSNRITTVCRSESEIKALRDETQRDLRRTQHQTGVSRAESGGL